MITLGILLDRQPSHCRYLLRPIDAPVETSWSWDRRPAARRLMALVPRHHYFLSCGLRRQDFCKLIRSQEPHDVILSLCNPSVVLFALWLALAAPVASSSGLSTATPSPGARLFLTRPAVAATCSRSLCPSLNCLDHRATSHKAAFLQLPRVPPTSLSRHVTHNYIASRRIVLQHNI